MEFLGQIFGDAAQAYGAHQAAQTAKATAPVQTAQAAAQTSTNWTMIALIGGGVLAIIVVLVVAFRR